MARSRSRRSQTSATAFTWWHDAPSNQRTIFGWTLIATSLIIFGLTAPLVLGSASLVDPQYPAIPDSPSVSIPPSAPPVEVRIDSLNVVLPVTAGTVHNNVWEVSRTGLSHLDISALPGAGGNIVIYGHNWRGLLRDLPQLIVGERIQVTAEDGAVYTYVVSEAFDVTPTDVRILQPTDEEVLTIYTCSGAFNQKRRVIRALPA